MLYEENLHKFAVVDLLNLIASLHAQYYWERFHPNLRCDNSFDCKSLI